MFSLIKKNQHFWLEKKKIQLCFQPFQPGRPKNNACANNVDLIMIYTVCGSVFIFETPIYICGQVQIQEWKSSLQKVRDEKVRAHLKRSGVARRTDRYLHCEGRPLSY